MILAVLISLLGQINLFSYPAEESNIYLIPIPSDSTKTETKIFSEFRNQQIPYRSQKDSLLTLRIEKIIKGGNQGKINVKTPASYVQVPIIDFSEYDKFGILKWVKLNQLKNQFEYGSFNISYNLLRGKAKWDLNVIDNAEMKLRLGMNLSYSYLDVQKLYDFRFLGKSVIDDQDRLKNANEIFVTYHLSRLDIISKYQLPVFQRYKQQFNNDRISLEIAYAF